MPKLERNLGTSQAPKIIGKHHVEKLDDGKRPAVVSTVPTEKLAGHLPKIEKLDVEKLAKKRDADIKGITGVNVVAEINTGVASPSGIAHLPTGELIVGDDDKGIYILRSDGKAEKLLKDKKDVEGVCVDDSGKHLWTVEEDARRVTRYDIKRGDDGSIELKESGHPAKLPKLKDVENKGWEGVTFLSKEVAGTKADQLVCVHEGNPRRIGIYALPDLDEGVLFRLPKKAKELLPDLADVAVDPKTGHLLVISDEAHTVVELAIKKETTKAGSGILDRVELAVVSSFEVPVKRSAKTEGLCFDDKGRLWVTLDGTGDALVLELKR